MNDLSLILARVLSIDEEEDRVYLEYRNGFIAVHEVIPPSNVAPGDVVYFDPSISEIEPAPADLWGGERWLGVVHSSGQKWAIVEVAGRLMPFPSPDFALKEGSTVLGIGPDQIVEVLSDDPQRPKSPLEVDDDINEAFKPVVPSTLDFSNFGGLPDVVERARELIEIPLQHRAELHRIGARPIKGVLFTGDPGTGKTMLARIIASKSEAKFFEVSGPEFLSKWYGQSERMLRGLFSAAAEAESSIIFFDEIDSIASQREEDLHEVSRRIVTVLLTEMDGFESSDNVVVIGATNRPEVLDPALRRPGRFDWEIHFRSPALEDRHAILEVSSEGIASDVDLPHDLIAARTPGWSAADLTAIWSEAALFAVSAGREHISATDYVAGYLRVEGARHRRLSTDQDARSK